MDGVPRRAGRYRLHPPWNEPDGVAGGGPAVSGFRKRTVRNGRLLRPDGPFVLRAGVPMPGAMLLPDAADLVLVDWRAQVDAGHISDGTLDTHSKHLARMVAYASARGAEMVCDLTSNVLLDWMHAVNAYTGSPVSPTTVGVRRGIVAGFFYTCFRLGITDVNPAAVLPSVPKVLRAVNAFTETDVDRLKAAAVYRFGETKAPAAVALCLLGCSSGEVGAVAGRDVRLLDRLVRAHGGSDRYTERWLPVDDDWCFDKLAARLRAMADADPDGWQDRPVAYDPRPGTRDDFRVRAAATSRIITDVLTRAGLKHDGVTRVASITEYVARRVFLETGRVEAVAARLGLNKLDQAAHICGYDWKTEFRRPGPGEVTP